MAVDILEQISIRLGLPCEWRGNTIVVKSPTGFPIIQIDTWSKRTMLSGSGLDSGLFELIRQINYPDDY